MLLRVEEYRPAFTKEEYVEFMDSKIKRELRINKD